MPLRRQRLHRLADAQNSHYPLQIVGEHVQAQPAMRAQWAEDQGWAHSDRHRQGLIDQFRVIRAALDAFNPDFVLIWGDACTNMRRWGFGVLPQDRSVEFIVAF